MSDLLDVRDNPQVLEHAINHVFLPPKLPQEADPESLQDEIHMLMCRVALDVVEQVQENLPVEDPATWGHLQMMLSHLHNTVRNPLDEAQLKDDFVQLPIGGKWRSVG
jgi:hypothetical protein